jgi:hypothetical protein
MRRVSTIVLAGSLVLSPLLILVYWLTYPVYGEFSAEGILGAVAGKTSATEISDAFAFCGALLAVPAALALMRVLSRKSPVLAWLGGGLSAIGWIAVIALLMTDVIAVELVDDPSADRVRVLHDVLTNPVVIGLNVLASLHLVGAVLLGIGLLRSGLIARWLAIGAIIAPPVHLVANLSGLLWIDSATWLVVAAAYASVVPAVWLDGTNPDVTAADRGAARTA